MKHITLLGIAAVLSASVQGQEIFQSGFEDWTGATPDGWVGAKTNLPAAGIEQVTEDTHGGDAAVRLIRDVSGHQRFTTQALTVENGQTYEVSFWVRGEGEIRVGLFDDRTSGSGYAPYSPYTTVAGNTWQQVTQTITAMNDATNAEFILSVQNTAAPEHLVVDDVVITAGGIVDPPETVTIQEIQETTAPDGASPLVNTTVVTSGVVTGIITGNNPGFFLQNGTGPWSGIFVFTEPGSLAIGDEVSLSGNVVEFNGQTQLTGVTEMNTVSSGTNVAGTVISTADANTEPYESVLVTVENAEVISSGAFGQFTINDGSGTALVDDVFYQHPFNEGDVYNITGVLQYAFNEWRILPRNISDVELITGIATMIADHVSVFPNPAMDIINLDVSGLEGRVEYLLTDAAGRVIMSNVITSERSVVEVNGLPNGIYALTLRNNNATWSTRVVVSH